MTRYCRIGGLFALAALGALPACELLRPQADPVQVPPLDIPAPTRAPPPLSVKDAVLVFPSLDEVHRDPFLTQAEQFALEHGLPVVKPVVVQPVQPVARQRAWHPRPAPIRHMALEFRSWIGGGGTEHAIAYDRKSGRTLQIWVGKRFGDWTVTRLTSSEIVLRYKDGRATDTYRFRVAAQTSPWSSP